MNLSVTLQEYMKCIHKMATVVCALYSTGAKVKQQRAQRYGAEALVLQPQSSRRNRRVAKTTAYSTTSHMWSFIFVLIFALCIY